MIFQLVEVYGIVLELVGFYYILHVFYALQEKKGAFLRVDASLLFEANAYREAIRLMMLNT